MPASPVSSSSSSSQQHQRFNPEKDQSITQNDSDRRNHTIKLSESNSSTQKRLKQVASESDSDEAPEVLSMVAGKRQIKQTEGTIEKFAKATARARRQANRIRDEKLKMNSKTRKIRAPIHTEIHSEEQQSSGATGKANVLNNTVATTIIQNTKKYLDPSLFVSASRILEQSDQASQARESEKSTLMASRRKKHLKIQTQNRREIGNNTTVVLLSKTEQITPAPRPTSEANFERNRLFTKQSRSRVKLPKSTLAAKAELGTRKAAGDSTNTRRAHKPSIFFARS